MKANILILFLLCSTGIARAQIQGTVVEEGTRLPISFASISYEIHARQKGIIADKQGAFSIPDNVMQLQVSCLGYKSKRVDLDAFPSRPLIIELEEQDFHLHEVTITPGNNPAVRIIQKVLENKDQNNYENYTDYAYRCYFKTTADIQSSDADSAGSSKSNRAMLISETVSLCQKAGGAVEEKIVATRTSGMKTPVFGQATYMLFYKAISFYKPSIQIFGESGSNDKMTTDYLSPLCTGCLSAYNYSLEEEYSVGNDTIFEITYYPKKNKNFSGLMGTMFVSSNGYAISSIVAGPHEKGLIHFKFKQDYKQIDGKWFPENMEEEIGFQQLQLNGKSNAYPAYFITSRIDSVSFAVSEKKLPNRLEQIFIDEKSLVNSQSIIDNTRTIPLTERETKAYHENDSALAANHYPLDMVLNGVTKVEEGKFSVKKIDIDFARIYSHNSYEGSRLGLGLHTNENLIKFVSIGGYVGYGLNDKKTKYGGDIEFTLDRAHDVKLTYSYQNSLKEAGRDLPNAIESLNRYYRNLLAYRFDHTVENKIEGTYHISSPLKIKASLSTRNLTPLYDYTYRGQVLSDYVADEMQFALRYAPGSRYSFLGTHRILFSEGNPVFNITYTRGVDFLRSSGSTYNKWEASMDIVAYHGRIGQSNLRLEGGYIDRSLPYGQLFTGEGSKGEQFSLFIHNSFQTLRPYEFLSDRYAHAFYYHNFGSLLFKTKVFSPEFLVAYNVGWGSLDDAQAHAIDFKTKNHVYQETGLMIDNLLRLKYLNILYVRAGVGGFYRLGYYREKEFKENAALKLVVSVSFK